MTRDDVEALRTAGLSDPAILEIVHVTGFFSYYNRLADGLGSIPSRRPLMPEVKPNTS